MAMDSVLSSGPRAVSRELSAGWRRLPEAAQQAYGTDTSLQSTTSWHVDGSRGHGERSQKESSEDQVTDIHDVFVRAYAVPAEKDDQEKKRKSRSKDSPKWPSYALIFDTETRITADQSLTFGVFRLCELDNDRYKLTREGLFHADNLPAKDRKVLEKYARTAASDAKAFPPEFPLYSRFD